MISTSSVLNNLPASKPLSAVSLRPAFTMCRLMAQRFLCALKPVFFKAFFQLNKLRPEDYTHFVIIPHFLEGVKKHMKLLIQYLKKNYSFWISYYPAQSAFVAVYEDFEKDIYDALEQMVEQLSGYQTIKIIFPDYTYHPKQILEVFYRFCN